MHKEITTEGNSIYDMDKAEKFFNSGKIGYRKLSLMKQENFKEALESGDFRVETIKGHIRRSCGYCFAFPTCDLCPIHRKIRKVCTDLPEWEIFHPTNFCTLNELMKAHKSWCKKIGLDVYNKK